MQEQPEEEVPTGDEPSPESEPAGEPEDVFSGVRLTPNQPTQGKPAPPPEGRQVVPLQKPGQLPPG